MNTPRTPPQETNAEDTLVFRLDIILTALRQLISTNWPIIGALYLPLHARLVRGHRRLARLFTRLATGQYPAPRAKRPNRASGPRGVYIPRAKSWLIIKFGYHAAGRASQLNHLLHAPETLALLAAAPPHAQAEAARILRPLCRMLGIPLPPMLQPPPRPPAPPKPKPTKPPRPPRLTARDIYPWRTARPHPPRIQPTAAPVQKLKPA